MTSVHGQRQLDEVVVVLVIQRHLALEEEALA
jgi:hypothetical protein